MAQVTLTRTVDAPLEKVWDSWNDYGNIDRFNPNLNGSHTLPGSAETGMGALRQCDLEDGKNYIRERIIGYEPGRQIKIDIYEGTLPLKRAIATFDFKPLTPARTEVQMTLDFTPKFGPLGLLMTPMLKAQMHKLLGRLLDGNKAYVETGREVSRAA